ncbi:MAG: hypothetical protein N3A02_03115, partial [Rectinema sp.]|nr:hypothetical protein [Rectinema sp.]
NSTGCPSCCSFRGFLARRSLSHRDAGHSSLWTKDVLASQAGEVYLSLTPAIPQTHVFSRKIHENTCVVLEQHPWLKKSAMNSGI